MLTHNFNRKSSMNVNDIIQGNIPNKIYSSILFNLVNLPYKARSNEIENVFIDNVEFQCYKNHYRFKNGTMVIIKIASTEFVPYGIYARKIINFLIAEYTYKMNLPNIYDEQSRRMINLGKKPIDFIEKICGKRKSGSSTAKSILQQLQAILNCRMAIATGYKQINPKDDESLAQDKYQFALIESHDDQLINHKFDVINNWQEEIYVSDDLAKILSSKIMPLDNYVYSEITSAMELDFYQYFTYQGHVNVKNNIHEINYTWEEAFELFGRGYVKNSKGLGNFRRDFRKNLESLQQKINLGISAPLDAKYITFQPQVSSILKNPCGGSKKWQEIEYESYKPMLDNFVEKSDEVKKVNNNFSNWENFVTQYDLLFKFDKSAITIIKKYFELDSEQTKKTIEYAKIQKPRNMSAYVMTALNDRWMELNESFKTRLDSWQIIYDKLTNEKKLKIDKAVSIAIPKLKNKWLQEQIDSRVLMLIFARYFVDHNRDILLQELSGSRYQTYFMQDFDLFNLI